MSCSSTSWATRSCSLTSKARLLRELNEVVSGTNEFREAEAEGKLIRLPTGDGMALVFRTDPEEPAQCAFEISRALKEHPRICNSGWAFTAGRSVVWWM